MDAWPVEPRLGVPQPSRRAVDAGIGAIVQRPAQLGFLIQLRGEREQVAHVQPRVAPVGALRLEQQPVPFIDAAHGTGGEHPERRGARGHPEGVAHQRLLGAPSFFAVGIAAPLPERFQQGRRGHVKRFEHDGARQQVAQPGALGLPVGLDGRPERCRIADCGRCPRAGAPGFQLVHRQERRTKQEKTVRRKVCAVETLPGLHDISIVFSGSAPQPVLHIGRGGASTRRECPVPPPIPVP
jgi:hypothetical protein